MKYIYKKIEYKLNANRISSNKCFFFLSPQQKHNQNYSEEIITIKKKQEENIIHRHSTYFKSTMSLELKGHKCMQLKHHHFDPKRTRVMEISWPSC